MKSRVRIKPAPVLKGLDGLTLDEAEAYLKASNGDEIDAARALARDRNTLDGSALAPDTTEIHHALYLLREARGMEAPSYDVLRLELKRRIAA
jgi:hypothetical protein